MTRLLTLLFTTSCVLLFAPAAVVCQSLDIQDVCDQTAGMQMFGALMKQYPQLYAVYSQQRNTIIYVPSDQAIRNHTAKTGHVFRRTDPSTAQAKAQMRKPQPKNRSIKRAPGDDIRSVVTTADDETSPGRNSVIVSVSPDPGSSISRRQLGNTTQSTDIKFFTGAGDTSKTISGEIPCVQGFAQIVDAVFTLPALLTETLQYTDRTKFLGSLEAANIVNDYLVADQMTVFVPIDSAFGNQTTINASQIGYHTINNTAFYTPYLEDGMVLETNQGSKLYVSKSKETFYINCVRVVQTDVITINGVAHAVEEILTPLYAPPNCGDAQLSGSNSTSTEPFTGVGSVDKVFSVMAIIGSIFVAMVISIV